MIPLCGRNNRMITIEPNRYPRELTPLIRMKITKAVMKTFLIVLVPISISGSKENTNEIDNNQIIFCPVIARNP